MKALIRISVTTMGFAAAMTLGPVTYAEDGYRYSSGQRYGVEWDARPGTDKYGSPAGNMAYDREIRLGAGTRSVGVRRNETVKFVFAGREFRWRFDTLREIDSFPLSRIAPADLSLNPEMTVFVSQSKEVDG